jgi:hypothetical protein
MPADHYHQGAELVGFDQDQDGVLACFADGRQTRGDLLVGADGEARGVAPAQGPVLDPAQCCDPDEVRANGSVHDGALPRGRFRAAGATITV